MVYDQQEKNIYYSTFMKHLINSILEFRKLSTKFIDTFIWSRRPFFENKNHDKAM